MGELCLFIKFVFQRPPEGHFKKCLNFENSEKNIKILRIFRCFRYTDVRIKKIIFKAFLKI
jgi:hypothetical protein